MTGKRKIIAFGEILWDLLPSGPRLGGAPYNFIYRMDSLGNRGICISRIGSDDLGDKILSRMNKDGVDTNYLQRDPVKHTGTVSVDLTKPDAPDYTIHKDVAYDYVQLQDRYFTVMEEADAFCFGTLAQRNEQSRNVFLRLLKKSKKVLRFCDINLRKECYTSATVSESLLQSDIVKISEEEMGALEEISGVSSRIPHEFAEVMGDTYKIDLLLISLGDKGGYLYSKKEGSYYYPGFKVRVADTCGAGDAFSAGFLHKYLQTQDAGESLRFANALGALVAAQNGATEPISVDEAEYFLSENKAESVSPAYRLYMK